jgi:hypothetical protein
MLFRSVGASHGVAPFDRLRRVPPEHAGLKAPLARQILTRATLTVSNHHIWSTHVSFRMVALQVAPRRLGGLRWRAMKLSACWLKSPTVLAPTILLRPHMASDRMPIT